MKLVALSLAIMLEFYFYSPDNSITKNIPALIRFSNLPSNMVIVEPPSGAMGIEAQIQIRGPKPLVSQIFSKVRDIELEAPLSLLPGAFPLRVVPQDLSFPSGIEVIQILPVTSRIKVEEVEGRELVLRVELEGELAEGYELKGIKLFPETVVARGPKTQIEKLNSIDTLVVDISDASKTFSKNIEIKSPANLIDVDVTLAKVEVIVEAKQGVKELGEFRVTLLTPQGYGATIDGSTKAKASISGSQVLLDTLTRNQVELVADASSLEAGVHQVPITGRLPEGLSLFEVEPKTLGVIIRGENGKTVRN